jgi:hypothetical protein
MTSRAQHLRDALVAAFGDRPFDATRVAWVAEDDPTLAAAIEAATPHCRYRSGPKRGRYHIEAIRHTLQRLARQHFNVDRHGFWTIKASTIPVYC